MSDRPVFIYAATYADRADAFDDYEGLLDLHAAKLVGTYDVALIAKDDDGKVHVHKHEKPTQHGAWGGIAVGAVAGILFPPVDPRRGVGRRCRRWRRRTPAARASRAGTRRSSGSCLEGGQAALIVIGESRVEEQLEQGAHARGEVAREGDRRR